MYTVKQLSGLAGISVRTLHHYDEIGLLKPSKIGANSYRYYDDAALLRLQQILFYREIGLELMQIRDILDSSGFNLISALRSHREVLREKSARLQNLISTIDDTIGHLSGEKAMSKRQMFEAFSDEQQKQYEREARLRWGPDNVNESIGRWNSYTQERKDAIMAESGQIYNELVAKMQAGDASTAPDVQAILARWHQNLRHFYEPTLEILRGLGDLYHDDADFRATFDKFHPDLSRYMKEGIAYYADELEHAEIVRMLEESDSSATHNQ